MVAYRCDLRRVSVFLALAAASVAALDGCAGTCASNCPPILFDILATTGENLSLATAIWTGPACPADPPRCGFDYTDTNNCARFSIIAVAPGTCEVDLTFSDGRAPFSVQAEFGPETHQGCCHGLPVIGATTAIIPPLHPLPSADAGIDGTDGASAVPEAGGGDLTGAAGGDASIDLATDSSDGGA